MQGIIKIPALHVILLLTRVLQWLGLFIYLIKTLKLVQDTSNAKD